MGLRRSGYHLSKAYRQIITILTLINLRFPYVHIKLVKCQIANTRRAQKNRGSLGVMGKKNKPGSLEVDLAERERASFPF